jgi:hypothetical protein
MDAVALGLDYARLDAQQLADVVLCGLPAPRYLGLVRLMRARVRAVWGSARPWERVALVVALLPIPGPLDELLGLLVARRVAARIARNTTR